MASANKAAVLQRHDENALLNTPAPPLVSRSEQDLSASQPRATVKEGVAAAAVQALRDGQTHYVDVPGIGPLRQALADYLKASFGAAYESDQVLVTAGVQESRFLTLQKIGEQFEQVAIPAVVDPGVRRALGTRPRSVREMAVDEENGYLPSVETIRETLEAGVRLLYLESPSRLSGKAYGADDVAAVLEMLQAFDAGLILDQGLAPWVADDEFYSPAAGQGAEGNVAILGELWPGAGLDSWFIGFIATPQRWFEPMRSQKQIMAICTSTASQYAALEAANRFTGQRAAQLSQLAATRERATTVARAVDLVPLPGEANAVLAVRCEAQQKAEVLKSLQESGYDVADGAGFGAENVLRLAITLDETTTTALESLN